MNFDVSDSKKSINSIEHTNSDGCFVSCYATATNTVTGESQTFYATSSAESCGVASIMCQSNALSQAMEYIADQ